MTGLNAIVQFVVAGAATAAYRRVSQFVDTVEQHERLLTDEEGTPDEGLVEDVDEHRRELIHSGLYPHPNSDMGMPGGEHMSQVTLSLAELLAVVLVTSTLAVTDGAALSRLGIAWLGKRLGVGPGEVVAYRNATDQDADSREEST